MNGMGLNPFQCVAGASAAMPPHPSLENYPSGEPQYSSPVMQSSFQPIVPPSEEEYPDMRVASMGLGDPPYNCPECDKTFTIPARLHRHLRVHTGEKPFNCEFCGKSFSVKENLNVHRRIHTKERPYQCTVCDRAFEHSGKLHRHMRTHTGERPHKCEICEKTFVQSGQLVIHLRAHTGEKPYECPYCTKGFTCSKQLKVHIRTHTGEKPYKCDICGKTFGYNHVLKMHKNSHMGERLYKCTICEDIFNSRKALDTHIKEHNNDNGKNGVSNTEPDLQSSYKGPSNNDKSYESGKAEKAYKPLRMPSEPETFHGIPHEIFGTREHLPVRETPRVSGSPLTPPRSPENTSPFSQSTFESTKGFNYGLFPKADRRPTSPLSFLSKPHHPNGDRNLSNMVFFTTDTGERLACPIDCLIRLGPPAKLPSPSPSPSPELPSEPDLCRTPDQESTNASNYDKSTISPEDFNKYVVRVLKACVGDERFKRLGYPDMPIDEVIINVLRLMGSEPCWEPTLSSLDRIKVNLRLLLEVCIPDQNLWEKFGWKGKSVECIILEFLNYC